MSEGESLVFPISYGKYELLERIGDGGMAEVFKARLPGAAGFKKTLVVKRILPHLARKKTYVDMFVAEATLAAQVQHRNVVQVFELGQHENGEFFMVMELVEGTDMRRLLRSAAKKKLRLPPWFSVHVVMEILEALEHAHNLKDDNGNTRNIVHRDVTPSNMFVSNLGEAKLGDFGVAHDTARSWHTQAGQLKGKVAYMAPEQLYSRSIDGRTDLFAIGVVLWECLTQRRLFGGGPDIEVMNKICTGPRRPATRYAGDVPEAIDALLLKALAPDPNERFRSARDMQDALLEVSAELGPRRIRPENVRGVLEVMAGRAPPESAGIGPLDNSPRSSVSISDSYPPATGSSADSSSGTSSGGTRSRSFSSTGSHSPIPVEDPLYYRSSGGAPPEPVRARAAVNSSAVHSDLVTPPPTAPMHPSQNDLRSGLGQHASVVTPPTGTTPPPNVPIARSDSNPNAPIGRYPPPTQPPPPPTMPPPPVAPPTARPNAWATPPPAPARAPTLHPVTPPPTAPPLPPKTIARGEIRDDRPLTESGRYRPIESIEQLKALSQSISADATPPPRAPPPRAHSPRPKPTPLVPPQLDSADLVPASDDIDRLVAAAVEDVREHVPEAKLEIVAPNSLLAGLDVRKHAERISEEATEKWSAYGLDTHAYRGPHPFWLRDNEGNKIGPCAYSQAIGITRAELRQRLSESSQISADGENWITLATFAHLAGLESLLRVEDDVDNSHGLMMGTLDRRSLAAVFGVLSRNESTGRLVVLENAGTAGSFRELEIVKGRPTYVYANEDHLQLPELLVAKQIVPNKLLPKLMHDAIREQKSLTSLASSFLASDLSRYGVMFMKERLVDLFGRRTGHFLFDESEKPKHTKPFAKSLIALLPELVHRGMDDATLEIAMRKYMDADFKASSQLAAKLDEMSLTRAQLGSASLLSHGRKISALVRQWPEDKHLHLTMAYVLIEAELLYPV